MNRAARMAGVAQKKPRTSKEILNVRVQNLKFHIESKSEIVLIADAMPPKNVT